MWIEWLIQFGPITLFFIVFELTGKNFFLSTGVLMAAALVAVLTHFFRNRKVALFPIFSATFTLFFGGATLYFRDPQFLILKDTLYDGIFGISILGLLWAGKNLMRAFFGELFAMSDRGWRILAFRWAIFFLIAALLNEFVRHTFSAEFWVHYKIANTIVFVIFGFYQFTLTKRERIPELTNGLGMRLGKKFTPKL